MIFFASGMEEEHTNNSRGVCGWAIVAGTSIDTTVKHTGNASMKLTFQNYVGSSRQVTGNKCWWSFASRPWGRNNGTYMYMFQLLVAATGGARYIGWEFNTGDSKYYLVLFDNTTGNIVATSTNGNATIQFYEIKIEFDNDSWTLWSNISGSWAEEFTYSDTTSGTRTFKMDFNFSTDASKINSNGEIRVDDCLAWDDAGDNWNSRIVTLSDFPKISVPHVLTTPESDSGQAVKFDEVPPDAVDRATVAASGYWATPPALDASVTTTIQAVMITHIWGTQSGEASTAKDFNMREGGTLHEDSGEDGRGIMLGTDAGGVNSWWQSAGYYPWSFDEVEWDATVFAGVEYGVSVIDTKTDQITVQAISFGSAHEWSPPASVTRRIFVT